MDGCSLNLSISALACAIAKDKSAEEIALLSAFFTQLGDSLTTIHAGNEVCLKPKCSSEKSNDINIS